MELSAFAREHEFGEPRDTAWPRGRTAADVRNGYAYVCVCVRDPEIVPAADDDVILTYMYYSECAHQKTRYIAYTRPREGVN